MPRAESSLHLDDDLDYDAMTLLPALRRPAAVALLVSLIVAGAAQAQNRAPAQHRAPAGAAGPAATRIALQVDPRLIRAHLEFLADDALEGRGTGSRGIEVAAKYIAAQFRLLGLEPAGDSGTYFQRVPLVQRAAATTLRVVPGNTAAPGNTATSGDTGSSFQAPTDYVLVPVADDTLARVTAEVVFAGYGIVAPNRGWDDYRNADVRGKIVLVLPGDPDSSRFDRLSGRPWDAVREKVDEAARRGAAGLFVVHSPALAPAPWRAIQSLAGERIALAERQSPVRYWGWITERAAAALVAGSGRTLDALVTEARAGRSGVVPLGVSLEATMRVHDRPIRAYNVVARLPGRGATAREAVLLGAHYDHVGIGAPVDGDSIYNGAEDNASGTAAMLAAAEAFAAAGARPARSVLFAAFAAEELGLLGAEEMASRPPLGLRLVGAINLDVLNLYGRTRDLATLGIEQSSLGQDLRAAAAAEGLKVIVDPDDQRRRRFYRSDQYAFVRTGVPALRILNGLDFVDRPAGWGEAERARFWEERYHRPSDEVADWMSFDGIVQQTRVAARTIFAAADAPKPPAWTGDSDFRALAGSATTP